MTTSTPPRRDPSMRRARLGGVALFLAWLAIVVAMIAGASAAPGAWVLLPIIGGFAAAYWSARAILRWFGREQPR